jgi:hypothetical protein
VATRDVNGNAVTRALICSAGQRPRWQLQSSPRCQRLLSSTACRGWFG